MATGTWPPKAEIPFTATLTFTPSQLEDLIKKAIKTEYGYDCSVTFKCGHRYDQMDRGPGTPILERVECTVINGTLKGKE